MLLLKHRSKVSIGSFSMRRPVAITTLMIIFVTWNILPSSFAFTVVRQPQFHPSSLTNTNTFRTSITHLPSRSDSTIRSSSSSSSSSDNRIPMQATPMKDNEPLKVTTQPTPVLWSVFTKMTATQKNTNNKAAVMAALIMLLSTTSIVSSFSLPADAAMSGGRMGGSFSRSSSSSFGGGGSRMRMAPSSSGSRSMYGGGYYGGPRTTIVAPIISPFATPFYNPIVPFYGGGVGAISYARGPGLFDLLFLGGIGFFVLSAISNTVNSATQSSFGQWDDSRDSNSNLFGLSTATATPTTVVKCNVALEVSNRDDPNSILSVLDRMAKVTAKTDTRKGVVTLTKQVALELLRRKSSIYSAAGKIQQYQNDKEAQRTYNQWSIQERSKFEHENVNKFNKFDLSLVKKNYDSNSDMSSLSSKATMAVITLVLSVDGSTMTDIKNLKKIQSLSDLETILQAIASMSSDNQDNLYGAEILWTPEDRSETLTKKDILADYPELNIV